MIYIESLRAGIKDLVYVYEEVFWLKECITVGTSLAVFMIVWRIVILEHSKDLLLYASAFTGVACIYFSNMGYWSSNDVLKLIAPIALLLLAHRKKQESDVMLFIFFVPYLFTSYALYASQQLYYGGLSLLSHPLLIFFIALVRRSKALSIFISILIGILINLVSSTCPSSVNDIVINPSIITLTVRGLEFQTKDPRYTRFLKILWVTLVCFAFFGSWAFCGLEPLFPPILDYLKEYVTSPLLDAGKHLVDGFDKEDFWLKECFTVGTSLLVFLFVWRVVLLGYSRELLLFMSALIGAASIVIGDIGYWSSNDILKLIAPVSLLLLAHKKKQESDIMLFIFLVPYFLTSYVFHIYKNLYLGGVSLLSIPFIIFCIVLVKQSRALCITISVIAGILINLIGISLEPGINDIIINPALITLAIRGLEFRTKDPRYTGFLKIFWITLICFAFFGSWTFHYLEPVLPSILNRR